ncbi:hypothetical protein QYE76_051123 [Lolium multiflorum]|uniref:BTB domain-containing protein n=1 Tax=Lolium multiflorum TaxID=4521 RepID=A0AAD8WHX0_LOLMU|nr:hypothetical protein QYE76_051123 [Lolium multiflorum]
MTVIKDPYVMEDHIEVPPSNITEQLGKLLDAKDGADVMFEVQGEELPAHKLVLAMRSPVFKALLYGPMKEKDSNRVIIDDMQPAIFKVLLHFIYTDSLPPKMDDDLEGDDKKEVTRHLLVAADRSHGARAAPAAGLPHQKCDGPMGGGDVLEEHPQGWWRNATAARTRGTTDAALDSRAAAHQFAHVHVRQRAPRRAGPPQIPLASERLAAELARCCVPRRRPGLRAPRRRACPHLSSLPSRAPVKSSSAVGSTGLDLGDPGQREKGKRQRFDGRRGPRRCNTTGLNLDDDDPRSEPCEAVAGGLGESGNYTGPSRRSCDAGDAITLTSYCSGSAVSRSPCESYRSSRTWPTSSSGGGPSHLAILSQVAAAQHRQRLAPRHRPGQVIDKSFGEENLCFRTHAAEVHGSDAGTRHEPAGVTQARVARAARRHGHGRHREEYRSIVFQEPRFVEYFRSATPETEYGRMNIGNRPSKRKASCGIESLRAIPWIFAWTQTRFFHLPVWPGFGAALRHAMDTRPGDPGIAALYDKLLVPEDLWPFGEQLRASYAETQSLLLQVAGHSDLLESDPYLRQRLMLRDSYITALNVCQAYTLKRIRDGEIRPATRPPLPTELLEDTATAWLSSTPAASTTRGWRTRSSSS